MSRYTPLESRLQSQHSSAIYRSHVLVVGAGGIGCEVLKNLVMVGFKKIDTIDLDIIDPSNLNRQFLFRPEHVNHPKATVAAQSAMAFNPDAHITSYHKNVKEPDFNVGFFEKYDLVLNALDNVDARRHVNRLCLASNTPLIESGTTGYIGQITPIVKGQMECYECRPKATAKVYPICTIRSTPDKPVHCIVWAKELFKLLLGPTAESMLFESAISPEDEDKASTSSSSANYSETSEYMKFVNFPDVQDTGSLQEYTKSLFTALFHTEVSKQIEAGVYKTSKKTPQPLDISIIDSMCASYSTLLDTTTNTSSVSRPSSVKSWERRVWSIEESLAELVACVAEVWNISRQAREEGKCDMLGSYVFDKDFRLSMCFVTAASNLRSSIFDIPTMSFHDAKGVAGNIIPAIASTNAIIAGLQVAQAIQLLGKTSRGEEMTKETCKAVFCQRFATRRGYYLQPVESAPPSEDCYVCNSNQQTLEIDTTSCTLGDFVKRVIKGKLGLVEPSVMIGASVIYEEGDDMDDSLLMHLGTPLDSCPAGGIRDSTLVTVEDFVQDLKITVLVRHVDFDNFDPEKCPEGFVLGGSSSGVGKSVPEIQETLGTDVNDATNEEDGGGKDSDDCCMIVDDPEIEHTKGASKKRNRVEEVGCGAGVKRPAL